MTQLTVIAAPCHVDEQKHGAIMPLFCTSVVAKQITHGVFEAKQKNQATDEAIFQKFFQFASSAKIFCLVSGWSGDV